jgi:hypothetical protein
MEFVRNSLTHRQHVREQCRRQQAHEHLNAVGTGLEVRHFSHSVPYIGMQVLGQERKEYLVDLDAPPTPFDLLGRLEAIDLQPLAGRIESFLREGREERNPAYQVTYAKRSRERLLQRPGPLRFRQSLRKDEEGEGPMVGIGTNGIGLGPQFFKP